MVRPLVIVLVVSAALVAAGCNEGDSPTEPIVTPPAFSSVYESQTSGIHAQRGELVFAAERWAEVWEEIHLGRGTAPALPAVDFSTEMIVLAAMGDQPEGCWKVQIASVTPQVVRVLVSVAQTRPPVACPCPAVVIQPVHVVRAKKLEAEGVFNFFRSFAGTCGN